MAEIRFETGLVSYHLNDACEVSFNPTDSAFVERLFHTFDTLDRKQEAYKAEICLLYTSPSPRDPKTSRMPSSA